MEMSSCKFIFLCLVYLISHNNLQLHLCCCKRHKFSLWLNSIPLCTHIYKKIHICKNFSEKKNLQSSNPMTWYYNQKKWNHHIKEIPVLSCLLFIIGKICNQFKYSLVDECIKKMWINDEILFRHKKASSPMSWNFSSIFFYF
jgi:hypothetical protein